MTTARRPAGRLRRRGFSLIELIVVVAVLGILAAMAAPSMSRLVAAQRVRTSAANLHLTLMRARSEALKRNAPVTLSAVNGDWSGGWNVTATVSGAPWVIDTVQAQGAVRVTASPSLTSVVFGYDGRTAQGVQFVVTSLTAPATRCVSIDPTGRPYTREAAPC